MNFLLLFTLALAPSIIWLVFFLRKDIHPESKRMILKIFFYGMLIAVSAAVMEMGILEEFSKLNLSPFSISLLNIFIGVALVEEGLKYLIIKEHVLNNSEFDEPVDIMLYMIIAALGFAALENILIFFKQGRVWQSYEPFLLSGFRFIGATFLHALCSGIVGYFLALSFSRTKRKHILLFSGLGLAVLLHGFYNIFIMKTGENPELIIIPIMILIGAAWFVFSGFKKVKKLKSVCKTN